MNIFRIVGHLADAGMGLENRAVRHINLRRANVVHGDAPAGAGPTEEAIQTPPGAVGRTVITGIVRPRIGQLLTLWCLTRQGRFSLRLVLARLDRFNWILERPARTNGSRVGSGTADGRTPWSDNIVLLGDQ